MPRIFQKVMISLLKNKRVFSQDFIQQINQVYIDTELATETLLNNLPENKRYPEEIDCRKSCFFCCGMIVEPTMPELYIIFDSILLTYSRSETEQLMSDLYLQGKQKRACKDRTERMEVKCAFLKNKSCSIHNVRPLCCRGWTSTDVNACKEYNSDPNINIPRCDYYFVPYDVARQAIMKSLYTAGFSNVTEELNSGILRLLKGEYPV